VLADYAEPLTVTTQADAHDAVFVNGIYPTDYISLPGIPTIKYKDEQFWASRERIAGAEVIEVDLGVAQAINFITFEVLARPLDIEIAYDVLDLGTTRNFVPVTPLTNSRSPRQRTSRLQIRRLGCRSNITSQMRLETPRFPLCTHQVHSSPWRNGCG
jgi:hypothetical protein